MLQYILNATGIWLISLLFYDLLLRRESYHALNRAYLWLTLIAGFLLPLYSGGSDILPTGTPGGIAETVNAKVQLNNVALPAAGFEWEKVLMTVYLLGAAIMLLRVLREAWLLLRLYWQGQKTKEGQWTVVTTGRGEAPFSMLNMLFVGDRKAYMADEWLTILNHEAQHRKRLHGVDLLLLQLLQIICWFHPLVYMYRSRLVLVHEYEADEAVAEAPQAYARFLLQQAGYDASPRIAHAFNQSPLKNRIVMLTKKSGFASKSKLLLALPMLLVCMALFTKVGYSGDARNGNKITYRGNTVELTEGPTDTVFVQNPVTGDMMVKIFKKEPAPTKLNGEKIYINDDVTMPATYNGTITNALKGYVFKEMQQQLAALPNGSFHISINQLVIDKTGKIVFYQQPEIIPYGVDNLGADVKKQAEDIAKNINKVLDDAPRFQPAMMNGKAVPVVISTVFGSADLVMVKNHKASF